MEPGLYFLDAVSFVHYLKFFSESEKQECMNFEKNCDSIHNKLFFCVKFDNSSWFGGSEVGLKEWPLNNLNWTNREYVTKDSHRQAVSKDCYNLNKRNKLQK